MTDLFADQQKNERDEIAAKWKDKPLEELLKAKIDSDLYIKTIERQKDEMRDDLLKTREELLTKAKFEDYIDQMKNTNNLQVAPPSANEESPKYDLKELEAMFENKIKQSKIVDQETANVNKVQAKLNERYGDNATTILKEQQTTLGLSEDDVRALARKSPEAFFRIMGLTETKMQESFQSPPRSGQRNDNFSPKGQTKRDYAFYQEMKKTNPKVYLDPKIAVQMHNDVMEMGEKAFYGLPTQL